MPQIAWSSLSNPGFFVPEEILGNSIFERRVSALFPSPEVSRFVTNTIRSSRASKLLVTIAALALFATACGGGSGPTSEQSQAAITTAEQNEPQLELVADLAVTELLDTSDGTITSLSEVVTGDRAVLLWYWAPH